MAYPMREDWIAKERDEDDVARAKLTLAIGPIAWLAYEAVGRRCTLEEAAAAVEDLMKSFGPQQVTVLSYLRFVERTQELIEKRLRHTAQSGSVDEAGGEQDPAPS
jgi:hypothetical protein